MEVIIIQAIFTIANVICALWQKKIKNYNVAIFNAFAAGVCFMGFLNAI